MQSPIIYEEKAHSIFGVSGRYFGATIGGRGYRDGTFTSQRWGANREFKEGNTKFRISVKIRFDDECRNGHNTFAITGAIDEWRRGEWRDYMGGCIHEEIEKHFPELKSLIRWHLVNTDSPMHYIANTIYLASDRDHWGKRAGEVSRYETRYKFGDFPISIKIKQKFADWLIQEIANGTADFAPVSVAHVKREPSGYDFAPHWTLSGYDAQWHDCPFETETEALEFIAALPLGFHAVKIPVEYSKGKERDLKAARESANWPEVSDETLMLPAEELRPLLEARLPALQQEFKDVIGSIGMAWGLPE